MGSCSFLLVTISCRRDDDNDPPQLDDVCLSRDGEQMGVLAGPRLGGLSMTQSSTSPFEKSMAVDVVSAAERSMYGFNTGAGPQLPPADSKPCDTNFFDPDSMLLVTLQLGD